MAQCPPVSVRDALRTMCACNPPIGTMMPSPSERPRRTTFGVSWSGIPALPLLLAPSLLLGPVIRKRPRRALGAAESRLETVRHDRVEDGDSGAAAVGAHLYP